MVEQLESRRLLAASISSTNFSSSGVLAAGATSLTVTFSEPVVGANVAANYELRRAGADGLLGSTDDPIIAIPSARYVSGTNVATLFFSGLVEDVHRLTVKDTITDTAGSALDGDGNGFAGGNGRRDFVVNNFGVAIDRSFGAAGIATTEFFNNPNSSENAQQVAVQGDGKIVAVGSNGVVRYLASGALDTSFGYAGKATFTGGDARSVAIQSDGKIVVAGSSYIGGKQYFALARYNVNGLLDAEFDGDGKLTTEIGSSFDEANSIAIQLDGKIVVAGYSGNGSNNDFALTRYNSDGSLDSTFDGDGKLTTAIGISHDYAYEVAIQSDGKIVVAGTTSNGSKNDFALTRYNSDGSLDSAFDGDGKLTTAIGTSTDIAYSLALQSDGKIVVAGQSYNGSNNDFALTRYDVNGSLDATFDGDGKLTTSFGTSQDYANSVAIQSDGKIVVAGSSNNGSNNDFALTRYNTNGSLDLTFDGDGKVTTAIGASYSYGYSVAMQGDGKIVFAGFINNGSNNDFALSRYNVNGSLDTTFDGDGKLTTFIGTSQDYAYSVAIQSDGKIVVAGSSYNGSNNDFALTRYNMNGSLDATFDGDGQLTTAIGLAEDVAYSVAIQSDGKIVVAGTSYNGSNYDFALTRYNVNGSLDTTFDGDGKLTTAIGTLDDSARSIAIQSDGKIVVAGTSTIGDNNDFVLTRYLENGALDPTFDGDGKLTTAIGTSNDYASSLAIQSDEKILVAGYSNNGSNDDFALTRYNVNVAVHFTSFV